ncbi:calcium-responsive transcription factor-like [Dendropsophus ebraccatus]|uniref:calcium-responsive transcription factor-like n=1 Tax=Dendropsophus ebraccatus TaxID=150705 RepID=UPI0038320EE3
MLQTFDTLQSAMQAVSDYEENTISNFVVLEKKKNFGNEACPVNSAFKIHWYGPVVNNISIVDFTGVPYTIVGRKVLNCHLGKDLATSQKSRYAEKQAITQTEDHHFVRHRQLYQCTKKMDCAAKIYIYHFLTFPDFQIKKNSEWHRKNASKKLKNCVQKENAKGVHSYVVLFPKISDHSNHPITGEAANLREKIDPRVQKKITELYRAGIRKKSELRRLIEHFVNNEIFLGLDVPEGSRRRFFPTRKDISNVIGRSKHLGHGSVLDQSMLVQLVDKWKMDDPSCSIFVGLIPVRNQRKKYIFYSYTRLSGKKNYLFVMETKLLCWMPRTEQQSTHFPCIFCV